MPKSGKIKGSSRNATRSGGLAHGAARGTPADMKGRSKLGERFTRFRLESHSGRADIGFGKLPGVFGPNRRKYAVGVEAKSTKLFGSEIGRQH